MKVDKENNIAPQVKSDPWWAYLVYASSNVLGRVLATRAALDGREKQRVSGGVTVSPAREFKPGIDPERVTATTIIGELVAGSDGKILGKVEEIAMDLTKGSISYLVLSVGGVFGFGDKFYALPLESLIFNPVEKSFSMNLDKKTLKKMPGFDKHNWPKKALRPIVLSE